MTRRSQSVTRRPTAASYTAFMDRLARAEEGSRQWTELAAGLVVLRAVDQWLQPTVPRTDVYQRALPAAVARVAAIHSESELQALLHDVIDRLPAAIDQGTKATIQSLQSAVRAYGFALELHADWDLAVETYKTAFRVTRLLPGRTRARLGADLNWRLAYVHRELGQFAIALRRYERMRALSVRGGWKEGEFRAQVGESEIIAARGDLPEAERRLNALVRQGEAYGLPQAQAADAWGLRPVRTAIEETASGAPPPAILRSVVDATEESAVADMSAIAPRLLAYGKSLEYDARYALAAEVYRAVIAHTHPVEDSDVAKAAYFQLAFCLRTSGNRTAAADAYRMAGEIALASNDFMGVLRARIGDAKIAIERGNLPRAEELLDQTIAESAQHGFDDIRSRALHDRSAVAFFRGDYETSVKFAYDALQCNRNATERDRMLNDLATSFMKLGVLSAARDAYLVLSATAQEQSIRWTATMNLMEVASHDGAEALFERYRRELDGAPLPPFVAAEYYIQAGEGYQRLGRTDLACVYLHKALSVATEHSFNQLTFYVEEALRKATAPKLTTPSIDWEASDQIREIAGHLRRLREFAGAG